MRVRGQDRQLPALPRARVDIEVLQRDGEQAGGDLLAGGDDGIVFARIENAPFLERRLAPVDELIGRARHRRNHDGDFMAGVDLALDVARDVADAVDIGDRGSAEFHDETGHVVIRVVSRRVFELLPKKGPRIDTGGVRPLQHDPLAQRFVTLHWIVIRTAN